MLGVLVPGLLSLRWQYSSHSRPEVFRSTEERNGEDCTTHTAGYFLSRPNSARVEHFSLVGSCFLENNSRWDDFDDEEMDEESFKLKDWDVSDENHVFRIFALP